jgi:prepilin-type N-terminal cleavage/methylation domain-containing protein
MKRNQSGFTLIEIAIVLVIIGLLLGGVLKGQELINSAKVKNLSTDFKNIPVFIYGYQDKFKALPGDDANAVSHLGSTICDGLTTCLNSTTSNGVIGGKTATDTWDDVTLANETQQFWIHARLAGLAPGPTSGQADYRPTNSADGRIGIQSNIQSGNGAFTTIIKNAGGAPSLMTGTYIICSTQILGKFVKQLDTTLDDGNTDTGSMRVADAATGKSMATASIDDGTSYTACMGF